MLALCAAPLWLPACGGANSKADVAEEWIDFDAGRLWSLSAGPTDAPLVLLLHGGRFSSETWRQLGTLEALAGSGLRVMALDLPGYGASEASTLPREELLTRVVSSLGTRRVLLVSPSMSGSYSLPFVLEHSEQVLGYVPISPVGLESYGARLGEIECETLVMWGSGDQVFPLEKGELLARSVEGARLSVFEGASHPCYLDDPERFHAELIAFARELGDS